MSPASGALGRGGIDDVLDLRDAIRGKPALLGMFADQFFAGGDVDAVDLVVGHVAVHPLDLWPEISQDAA